MNIKKLCYSLPKIELHAHLNGSLSRKTLAELGCLNSSISKYNLSTKSDKSLEYCFQLFDVAHSVTNNADSVYKATKSVIQDFITENVIYLEIRTTPRAEQNMTREEYIEAVVKAIQDSKDKDIIVKLLLSIDRKHSKDDSDDVMTIIINMKQKYPTIIKGVDLSGNPAVGNFDEELFIKARNSGLSISLHCAEVKNDEEVLRMLQFRPDRLGHATNLHPKYGGSKEIWNVYQKHPIPVECCLTSNVVCETSKSYGEHHVKEWIDNSLPFSLNTDDKGVFDTTLSKEFGHAAENFSLNILDLWTISYKSIDHAFASDDEKAILKKKMNNWLETNNLRL